MCFCTWPAVPCSFWGLIINPLQYGVWAEALPVAVLGSIGINCCIPVSVYTASFVVFAQGRPVCRTGDVTYCGMVRANSLFTYVL